MIATINKRSWFRILGVFLFALFSSASFSEEQKDIVVSPTGSDFILLAYTLAGTEPPFKSWADSAKSLQSLNEFKRGPAAAALETQLRARFQQLKDVRRISITINSQLGEYDSRYGEFGVGLTDGTFVEFHSEFGPNVAVHLINGGAAQSWSLPPSDAERALQIAGGTRIIHLAAKLQLLEAILPTQSYEPISVNARVIEYDVLSWPNSHKLGHVVVK